MGWRWAVYYLWGLYVLLCVPIVVWKIPESRFARAIGLFVLVIIGGGTLQPLLPAHLPCPANGSKVQRWFHQNVISDPFVCFPSMHVALAVLAACMAMTVFHSRWFRLVTAVLVSTIILSTLTLKEHYVLDAVAGLLLGTVSLVAWKSDFGFNVRPARKGACNEPAEKVPV